MVKHHFGEKQPHSTQNKARKNWFQTKTKTKISIISKQQNEKIPQQRDIKESAKQGLKKLTRTHNGAQDNFPLANKKLKQHIQNPKHNEEPTKKQQFNNQR